MLEDQEIPRLMYKDNEGNRVRSQEENPFYAHQQKLALRHIGKIDPENIEDYLELGGYEALRKALQMTPDEVITEVEESGLRDGAAPDSLPEGSGAQRLPMITSPSMWPATATRETRAHSWTGRSWKAIPMR